ncbi:MAG: 3-oxoacyl-ACP synthase III, partial [Pirellulales bacterium]|nr:3-oxoacyl-ACP synthase III [Pirellulales bacterium]
MYFRYEKVCLETIVHGLPRETVTSEQIESRLAPLYERLRLPEGRLELMSGIRQRRFWPPGTRPGQMSIETGRRAIDASGIEPRDVGTLIHGSVCRDYVEPATAAGVHHGIGLSSECLLYDVSNACLGLLNGMVQVANMIELGQIRAGLVVGTESSRELVETTIEQLNADESLTRKNIKSAFASLTIGSGSAAVLLVDRELSRSGNRLVGGVAAAATDHCDLCRGGYDEE